MRERDKGNSILIFITDFGVPFATSFNESTLSLRPQAFFFAFATRSLLTRIVFFVSPLLEFLFHYVRRTILCEL